MRLVWPVLNAFTISDLSDAAQGAKSLSSAGSPIPGQSLDRESLHPWPFPWPFPLATTPWPFPLDNGFD